MILADINPAAHRYDRSIFVDGLDFLKDLFPVHLRHYDIEKYDIRLDASSDVYVMGGAGALHVIDLDGTRRLSTLQDLRDLTRLEDTLENMDIAHFLVTPQDIPQDGFEMITFAEMLKNNTRNFYALIGGCREGLSCEMEMASASSARKDSGSLR